MPITVKLQHKLKNEFHSKWLENDITIHFFLLFYSHEED